MTREEAISIMNVIVHMLEPIYDTDRIEDAVTMAIKALEQEPKQGHWKTMAYSNGGAIKRGNIIESELYGIHYECSLCHFTYVVASESKEPKDKQMYCPSCGAKMFEPQESEGENAT